MTKRELIEENERLRNSLEQAYDLVSGALEFDDEDDGDDEYLDNPEDAESTP